MLEDRDEGADQQGADAGAADDQAPGLGAREHGPQPDQQKDARFDHGRRVQIGRHRRGGRHRLRQPEVEGELRALGQRAQRDQHQRGQVPVVLADAVTGGEHGIELVAADDVAEQQHAGQQAEPAHAGDGEGHARAASGIRAMVPVADQHEGDEAGELPEQHQLDQVAGQHHALHGAHEGQQEGEEARHRILRRHVVARVDHHQHAHALDQAGEQPGEPIHAHTEVQALGSEPGPLLPDHLAVGNRLEQAEREQQSDHGSTPSQPGFAIARIGRHGCSKHGTCEGQEDQEQ